MPFRRYAFRNGRFPRTLLAVFFLVFAGVGLQRTESIDVEIELVDGRSRVGWASEPGQVYVVEVRDALDSGEWEEAATVSASDDKTWWADAGPVGPHRFYRVGYQVEETVSSGKFVHASSDEGLLRNLSAASFGEVRDRLLEMSESGTVVLPIPVEGLGFFEALSLPDLRFFIDEVQRAIVLKGETTLLGQRVQAMLIGVWGEGNASSGQFAFSVRFPKFRLSNWVSGLSGTVLDDLNLDDSVVTLTSESLQLDLSRLPGAAAAFVGSDRIDVQPGLSINREIDLGEVAALSEPLEWLGFTDTRVQLEGYLGVDVNALFSSFEPSFAPTLWLKAHFPVSQSSGYPAWISPSNRIFEFTNDPAVRVRLKETLVVRRGGSVAIFNAFAEIDTSGEATSIGLSAGLANPWRRAFGTEWLTLEQASLGIAFDTNGAGEATLEGSFLVGGTTVSTNFALRDTETGIQASAVASLDELTLNQVLDLFSGVTGPDPFGPDLPDNALALRNVEIAFDTASDRSFAVKATTALRGAIETEAMLTFAQTESDGPLLILGLRVSDFQLNELYAGVDGTVLGDIRFPGAAFTIVQDLPDELPELPDDLPDLPDLPDFPDLPDKLPELPDSPGAFPKPEKKRSFKIDSEDLFDLAKDFFEREEGEGGSGLPFELEFGVGGNFSGTFAQSKLPPLVLNAFGMDPAAEIKLDGSLSMRVGSLAGGGLLALDHLSLKATLPAPIRERVGFPEWLSNIERGQRVLEFAYDDPEVKVRIRDAFSVMLDGATRDFVTHARIATDGDQASLTIGGGMVSAWERPFGLEWLDLNGIGLQVTTDGSSASASLYSTFGLGDKEIDLEMAVSGGADKRSLRVSGKVDSLSLSDFVELAQMHLGVGVAPFGDSSFDFTFTDVGLTVETGSRSSFSLGGKTLLRDRLADALFSATTPSGGGSPQIVTGLKLPDWSLADALEGLQGTLLEGLRFDTATLVFAKGEGTSKSSDMSPETRAFYGDSFGGGDFNLPFKEGLSLLGSVPLDGNPIGSGLDALGMSTDSLFLGGTIPGSVLGLGGGGGGLGGLSLQAALPPMSPPGAPEWFVEGSLALEVTAQPSVGFVGEITTLIEGDLLTFSVGATLQRVGPNVEFALAGGLSAAEPWEQPFGIEWLIFNEARVKVAVNAIGSITLGFSGDLVIGEKDIATVVAATVNVSGVPTNFIFEGASEAGVEMADLVALQQAMARVTTADAPLIPLESIPELAVKSLELKFAPRGDPDLGVEAGFALSGQLWIPVEANGPPERNFAGIELSVGADGILAVGHVGAFELGPLVWDDALLDVSLSLLEQHFILSGGAEVGELFQGELDLGISRTEFSFSTTTELYDSFEARLDAAAAFSFSNPQFMVHGLMQNDFNGGIATDLRQRVRSSAIASVSVADKVLRRGLNGWTSFRSNPHALSFATRITGFATVAGWPTDAWSSYVNGIQDVMNTVDAVLFSPPNLLDLALGGAQIPGVPGIKITILGQDFCNGIPYGGGPCWTVPPINIPGACNFYAIPCSSGSFINQMLIPPLISRIDTILVNQNKGPLVVIESAEFEAALDDLATGPEVAMEVQASIMRADPVTISVDWNFEDLNASLNHLRDGVLSVL